MKIKSPIRAFSLIDLLVAIGVISIVAAVIVPKFLNVQQHSKDTIATQISSELNTTYANWKGSGGTITGTSAYGSVILAVLSNTDGTQQTISTPDAASTVADTGSSQNVRINLPPGAPIQLNPNKAGGLAPTNAVATNDYLIAYSNGADQFMVLPISPGNLTWSPAGWPSDTLTISPLPSSGGAVIGSPLNYSTGGSGASGAMVFTCTVQKNGVVFGTLSPSNTNGSFYAYDSTSGSAYRADYRLNSTTTSSTTAKNRRYVAMRGYSAFRSMGVSAGGPFVPIPTASWTITYFIGH
jgi:type II secretory pathway pseudopilin PulG